MKEAASDRPPVEQKAKPARIALSTRKKVLFGLVATLLFFAAVEGGLRLIGFKYESRVESMQFTFPLEHFDVANLNGDELAALLEKGVPVMQRDPILFWKPVPNLLGHNSRCVHGPEFAVPKPPCLFRIVCLGDSCTHFGPDSYPTHLQSALKSRHEREVEVINAGVAGYSSHQGLARLRSEVVTWEPDVVTVYFGWNDHWLARGIADRQQRPQINAMSDLLSRYRVYQLLLAVRQNAVPAAARPYRVPPGDYADNLRQIKVQCDSIGAKAVFITAPQALDRGIPAYLTKIGEVSDVDGLVALHARYNEIVRQMADELRVPVVDLDREFDSRDKSALFIEDHIHLSQEGRTLAGELIAEVIERAGSL